jgi:hypothetical protein
VIEVHRVGAVLWRRATAPPGHPGIADPDERAWAAREDGYAVQGVLRSLPAYWMSHPDRIAAIERVKAVQLADAARLGVRIPATLITTHGDAAARWMDPKLPYIYKAFRAPFENAEGRALVEASRITDPPAGELYAACNIQPLIEGTPLRVTVVGEEIYAVAIDGDYDIDWRLTQLRCTTDVVDVPAHQRRQIRTLMAHWGLTYGALDYIREAATGEWVFLEINPTGAFGFVEQGAGVPISARIAETLATAARHVVTAGPGRWPDTARRPRRGGGTDALRTTR